MSNYTLLMELERYGVRGGVLYSVHLTLVINSRWYAGIAEPQVLPLKIMESPSEPYWGPFCVWCRFVRETICFVMLTKKQIQMIIPMRVGKLGNETKPTPKYLGVTVDSKISFGEWFNALLTKP